MGTTNLYNQMTDSLCPTSILVAWEGTLATRQYPEHEVGHPEGEADDGVAEDEGENKHHYRSS